MLYLEKSGKPAPDYPEGGDRLSLANAGSTDPGPILTPAPGSPAREQPTEQTPEHPPLPPNWERSPTAGSALLGRLCQEEQAGAASLPAPPPGPASPPAPP